MTLVERVQTRLPADIAIAYAECVGRLPEDAVALQERVNKYLAHVRAESKHLEFLDLATAEEVARSCEQLILRLDSKATSAERLIVQAAVEYFVLADDVEDDTASVIGFDDDLLVVRATAEALGWPIDGAAP